MRRDRICNLFISLSLSAASIVLVLLLFEAGLRIAGWRRSFETIERIEEGSPRLLAVRTLHANRVIHHVTKEFDVTYRTNSLGYFDREWEREKPRGTVRIGFFGDSFTMGHGVGTEKAFPRLLEKALGDRWGLDVETMNFGIWGSGTLDEREYIDDALALGIDRAVICFYVNDLFDNVRYIDEKTDTTKTRDEDGIELLSGSQKLLIPLKNLLNDHSRTFGFVMERSKNLRDALGLVTYPLEGVFSGKADLLVGETAGYLNSIARDLEEAGIPLTVVYLPAKIQTGSEKVPESFDIDLPNRILAEKLDGPFFIDLTAGFRDAGAEGIWFREGHYTEEGHRLAARLIAEKLPIENK